MKNLSVILSAAAFFTSPNHSDAVTYFNFLANPASAVTASGTSYQTITFKLGHPQHSGTLTAGGNYWQFGTPVSGTCGSGSTLQAFLYKYANPDYTGWVPASVYFTEISTNDLFSVQSGVLPERVEFSMDTAYYYTLTVACAYFTTNTWSIQASPGGTFSNAYGYANLPPASAFYSGTPSFCLGDSPADCSGQPPTVLCNPPKTVFVDNTAAAGLVEAVSSTPQLVDGQLTTNITLTNELRFWLGVLDINATPGATFVPNMDVDPEGMATSFGLVTPCAAGLSGRPPFISCTQPGGAAWTAKFCNPGSITIDLGGTPLSAVVTLTDVLIPGSPLALTVTLAKGFEQVPDFVAAAQCVLSGGSKTVGCVSSALSNLASNPNEVAQMQQVLAAAGINLTINQLTAILLGGVSLRMIETLGDLIVFGIDTASAGHYGTITVKIIGR